MLRYDVKPEIEVFDLAMLYNAVNYVRDGLIKAPLHVQFVLGVKHALPAERDILEFEVAKLAELMPEATWVAAGIGRHQLDVNRWCLEMGVTAYGRRPQPQVVEQRAKRAIRRDPPLEASHLAARRDASAPFRAQDATPQGVVQASPVSSHASTASRMPLTRVGPMFFTANASPRPRRVDPEITI